MTTNKTSQIYCYTYCNHWLLNRALSCCKNWPRLAEVQINKRTAMACPQIHVSVERPAIAKGLQSPPLADPDGRMRRMHPPDQIYCNLQINFSFGFYTVQSTLYVMNVSMFYTPNKLVFVRSAVNNLHFNLFCLPYFYFI